MTRGWTFVAACAVALALAGCSGTARLTSKSLCENSGGRYAQGTCQPGTAMRAEDMCRGFGGIYFVQEDLCHISTR
jgi:hypothetical protein